MEKEFWYQFQILTKRSEKLKELCGKSSCPKNVCMGESVENVIYINRSEDLLQCHTKIKFLYPGPILGSLVESMYLILIGLLLVEKADRAHVQFRKNGL